MEFLNALLQMFRVAAIYFVVLALTDGTQSSKPAWLALGCELTAIFGGAVTASISKMLQTHAGYFMAAAGWNIWIFSMILSILVPGS